MSTVKIVSYKGYYHMYKKIDGQHWVGMIDHRIGGLTNQITEEEAMGLESIINDDCYTKEQIESFEKATVEHLKAWENV